MKIKRSDLIVLPGGPEFIVNNGSNLLDHLRILVKAHQIKEIILISHSDCGYYNICLANASKGEVLRKQLDDVQKAIHILKKIFISIKVHGFHAYLGDSKIIEYTQVRMD